MKFKETNDHPFLNLMVQVFFILFIKALPLTKWFLHIFWSRPEARGLKIRFEDSIYSRSNTLDSHRSLWFFLGNMIGSTYCLSFSELLGLVSLPSSHSSFHFVYTFFFLLFTFRSMQACVQVYVYTSLFFYLLGFSAPSTASRRVHILDLSAAPGSTLLRWINAMARDIPAERKRSLIRGRPGIRIQVGRRRPN
ncbi:hypothetical protein FB451DRAFT_1216773 [Mycena latifolia]|nr:hypothetical protein FB451DRAFT_1216773 [Mycena latifolia]